MKTVLIVDDNRDLLEVVAMHLSGKYRVLTADCGTQAVQVLEQNKVDVILADQVMPDIEGVKLLEIAHEQYPHIARILFTGWSDERAAVKAINDAHVHNYLTKPWTGEELETTIERAIVESETVADEKLNTSLHKLYDGIVCFNLGLESFLARQGAAQNATEGAQQD